MEFWRDSGGLVVSGSKDKECVKDVYFYWDVIVLYFVCNVKGKVYRIWFDVFYYIVRKVFWDRCKCFKNGFFLCLVLDDFYMFFFVIVEGWNFKEFCLGEFDVWFEGVDFEILNEWIDFKMKFDMVEFKVFFEVYRYVLEGMKEIYFGDLFFEKYIVKCKSVIGVLDYKY